MNRRYLAALLIPIALLLGACTDPPATVKPDSRCQRHQKGQEVTNPDGRQYECEKRGFGKRNYRWTLDD